MTDSAWIDGMSRLKSCTLDRAPVDVVAEVRWREYRERLDHLSDEQWRWAVNQGVCEEFFPSIGKLASWGAELPYRRGSPGALQLEDGEERNYRSDEQQAINQAGLKSIRETLAARGIFVDDCAKRMPSAKP